MTSATIPFLIAKAHAYHSQAPTLEQIHNMVQAKSITDIESILQQTHYGVVLSKIRPSVNLTDFEVELRRNFARLIGVFKGCASQDAFELMKAYELTIEAENMSMILQAIFRENVSDELKKNIIPVGKYGMEYYERMIGITRVEAAIDLILHSGLKKAAESAFESSIDPDEQVFYLTSNLSHTAYKILNKVVPIWTKGIIETTNLTTVARAINLGIDPTPWLIDNGGLVYQNASTYASMKSPREALTYALNHHFPKPYLIEIALSSEEKEMVNVFEQNAQQDRYYQHKRSFRIFGNRVESILDFFFIKKAEIEDISRILLGNLKSIPSDTILNMLALPLYRRKQT